MYERAVVGVAVEGGGGAEESEKNERSTETGKVKTTTMTLGRNVVVEGGATVEACEIGDLSVVEVDATVGVGCRLGRVSLLSRIFSFFADLVIPTCYLHNDREKGINQLKSISPHTPYPPFQ